MLAAHDAETTNSHKDQTKLGKQVNHVLYDRDVTSLDGLPTHERPPEGSAHSGRAKPANAQRLGNGVSQDQELPRGYDQGR